MKKLVNVNEGEIFAIPLFLSNEKDNKSFSRDKFKERGKEFVFCRVIEDRKGGGIIIEVFDLIGDIDQSLEDILKTKRLFKPVAISGLGIYKKRWKKIYQQSNYNKEKHSEYSKIKFVMGFGDDLQIWQNGTKKPIDRKDAEKYEIWDLWRASHLEKRIIKELSLEDISD
jgi:hypothetical protein